MVLIKRTDKNIHVVRLSMKVLIKNTRSVEYLEVTFMLRNNWSENMKCWLQTECFTFLLIYMFFIMFCSRHFKDGNIYKKKHKKNIEISQIFCRGEQRNSSPTATQSWRSRVTEQRWMITASQAFLERISTFFHLRLLLLTRIPLQVLPGFYFA